MISTATVLPCTPSDINDLLSMVFIGPRKFKAGDLGGLFHVCKHKILHFLKWLFENNRLYKNLCVDSSIFECYPDDGPLPGIEDHVVQEIGLESQKKQVFVILNVVKQMEEHSQPLH